MYVKKLYESLLRNQGAFFLAKKMKKDQIIGTGLAITGVLCFSLKAILVKFAYQYGVTAIDTLLLRMLFSFPFYLFALIRLNKVEINATPLHWLWLVILGLVGYYISSLFDFMGLYYISATLERLILFTYPTYVVVMGSFLFKRKIQPKEIVAIVVTYIGVLVIFSPDLIMQRQEASALCIILIFLCAITYGMYLVGTEKLIPVFGAKFFTSATLLVSAIAVFVHFIIQKGFDFLSFPTEVYVICLIMAIFSTVLPSYMISAAIQKIGSPKVAIMGGLGILSTIIMSVLFLGDTLAFTDILGGAFIVVGVMWLNLSKKKK